MKAWVFVNWTVVLILVSLMLDSLNEKFGAWVIQLKVPAGIIFGFGYCLLLQKYFAERRL